jgi:hypothetical protein
MQKLLAEMITIELLVLLILPFEWRLSFCLLQKSNYLPDVFFLFFPEKASLSAHPHILLPLE